MPDYLPTAPRLALILLLAVLGFTVGPVVEAVQEIRRRRYLRHRPRTLDP